MTSDEFREMALGFSGAFESAHMNHPDFRANGKIFASLGYPDGAYGMVKLTPEQQQALMEKTPAVFKPCAGAWGRAGSTSVHLASAKKTVVRVALEAAYRNVREQVKSKEVRRTR
jgi:hypothetical protein